MPTAAGYFVESSLSPRHSGFALCPKRWINLAQTSNLLIRHCETSDQDVMTYVAPVASIPFYLIVPCCY